MGASSSSTSAVRDDCKDGSCLTKAGTYKATHLQQKWKGTSREGYRYEVGYAPTGRATCGACKEKIDKGGVRIGRSTPSPFDAEGGATDMTKYFHATPACAFTVFARSKAQSKVPTKPGDLKGIAALAPRDRARVEGHLKKFAAQRARSARARSVWGEPPRTAS